MAELSLDELCRAAGRRAEARLVAAAGEEPREDGEVRDTHMTSEALVLAFAGTGLPAAKVAQSLSDLADFYESPDAFGAIVTAFLFGWEVRDAVDPAV